MTRRNWIFLILVVGSATFLVMSSSESDMVEVEKGLAFYNSSMSGIAGSYQMSISPVPGYQPASGSAVMEGLRTEVQFIADLNANRTRMDELRRWKYSWFSEDCEFAIRELHTFDGNKPQSLFSTFTESPVPVDIPRNVPMYLNVDTGNTIAANFGPANFCGRRVHGYRLQSLLAMVESKVLRVTGKQDVDGHHCLILTGEAEGKKWTVALDPNVDFLPREIVWAATDSTAKVSLHNSRFAQFDDGSGNRRWFPTEGNVSAYDWRYSYVLKELQLNPQIDAADFTISLDSLPPGVQFFDGSSFSFTGNDSKRFEELKKLTDASDQMMEVRFRQLQQNVQPGNTVQPEGMRIDEKTKGRWAWPALVALLSVMLVSGVVRKAYTGRSN